MQTEPENMSLSPLNIVLLFFRPGAVQTLYNIGILGSQIQAFQKKLGTIRNLLTILKIPVQTGVASFLG